MKKNINYNDFLKLLRKYEDNFTENVLKVLYEEFGEEQVNKYFDYHYKSLDEIDADIFYNKFFVYFEAQINKIDEKDIISNCENFDVVKCLINNASRYPIMNREMEKEQAFNLNNGNINLNIIKKVDDFMLYPDLCLEKIFLSVKNSEDLEYIKKIKKLPYILGDESIFANDMKNLKKFISLSNNKILSLEELRCAFPDLSFNGVSGVYDLKNQIDILEKYINAKFNLYNRNLRLVIWVAKKGTDSDYFADKIQEGNLGLIKAINRYDFSKGYKFATYATWWIKQSVFRFVDDNVHTIRRPVHLSTSLKKYNKFVEEYRASYGITPSVKECCKALKYDEEKVINLRTLSLGVLSLDEKYGDFDENDSLINHISDDCISFEDTIISDSVVSEICYELREVLNDRSYDILMARLGLEPYDRCYTLKEISDRIGLTRERVRQIESKSIRILRNIARRKDLR